jgi:hypothetical protein
MIKKNTKVIFEDNPGISEDLAGGIPLSKGETITIHNKGKKTEYIIKDKKVEWFMDGKDQEVNIIYFLKKK